MIKILLVEDDKNLREIYGVRLLAEGYDIVSASDGEEALAMAIKERPHLIISDVMMPQISGFDMLDILRSTTETRSIKVIIMTALSSEDQRRRGEQLGADRYLVKSQVGIEDVVRTVHEVLGDTAPAAAPVDFPTQAAPKPAAAPATSYAPVQPANTPAPAPAIPQPLPTPTSSIPQPTAPFSTPRPASLGERIIQPLNDISRPQVDMKSLLDKELAAEEPAQSYAPSTLVSPAPAPSPAVFPTTSPEPASYSTSQGGIIPEETPTNTTQNSGDIDAQLDAIIANQAPQANAPSIPAAPAAPIAAEEPALPVQSTVEAPQPAQRASFTPQFSRESNFTLPPRPNQEPTERPSFTQQ